MTRPHPHDAGLRAVARVREVRERDGRLEVGEARLEQTRAVATLDHLEQRLAAPVPVTGAAGGFAQARTALLGLHEPLTRARADVTAAEARAVDALARWQVARTRLAAVEGLLERRAEARAEEARRAEARELDDIAGRLHQAARRAHDRHDTHTHDVQDQEATA